MLTKEQLDEMRNCEKMLFYAFHTVQVARKRLMDAFNLVTIEYDWEKRKIKFVGEGPDSDVTGGSYITAHSVDEMVQDGWADVENEDKAEEEQC